MPSARPERWAPLNQKHEFFRAVGALDLARVRDLLREHRGKRSQEFGPSAPSATPA